uniref:Uncharacterized protein n=1 Tax=Acrobeloides nanus TaxID=290746 RepID=A0A914E6W4_9BILA
MANEPKLKFEKRKEQDKPKLDILQCICQFFRKIFSFITCHMFRCRQFTYTLERRATIILTRNLSICARNVHLVQVRRNEDKMLPFEFLMTYMCTNVDDALELKRNPQKISYLKEENVDKILEDVAFMLEKTNQLCLAEQKVINKKAPNITKKRRAN